MNRCVNPNYRDYYLYGGRGISVCADWQDAAKFIAWAEKSGFVENKKRGACTLDRIDVNGDYEPLNCRWVDMKTQSNNKRTNIYIEIGGAVKTATEWAEIYGIDPKLVHCRIARGWDGVRAVTA